MGSRSNRDNKFGFVSVELTPAEKAARDREWEARMASASAGPATVKEPANKAPRKPPGEAGPRPKPPAPRKPKRPAPRTMGGLTNPSDIDDYLEEAERGPRK